MTGQERAHHAVEPPVQAEPPTFPKTEAREELVEELAKAFAVKWGNENPDSHDWTDADVAADVVADRVVAAEQRGREAAAQAIQELLPATGVAQRTLRRTAACLARGDSGIDLTAETLIQQGREAAARAIEAENRRINEATGSDADLLVDAARLARGTGEPQR